MIIVTLNIDFIIRDGEKIEIGDPYKFKFIKGDVLHDADSYEFLLLLNDIVDEKVEVIRGFSSYEEVKDTKAFKEVANQ